MAQLQGRLPAELGRSDVAGELTLEYWGAPFAKGFKLKLPAAGFIQGVEVLAACRGRKVA